MASAHTAARAAGPDETAGALYRRRVTLYLALLAVMLALFAPHVIDWIIPESIFPTLLPYSLQNELNPRIEFTLASYISAAFFAVLGATAMWGAYRLRRRNTSASLGYLVLGLVGLYVMIDEPIGLHERLAAHVDAFLLNALGVDVSTTPIAHGHSWALLALPAAILLLLICRRLFREYLRERPALIVMTTLGLAVWAYAIIGELLYGTLAGVHVERLLMLEEWTEEASEILGAILLTVALTEGIRAPSRSHRDRWWPWNRLWRGSRLWRWGDSLVLIGPLAAAAVGDAVILITGYGQLKLQAMLGSGAQTVAVIFLILYAAALYELVASVAMGIVETAVSAPTDD